jgi:antitoxin MazE
MQVSKWGNSLAIRLPASVVEALALKEGDEIEITIEGERKFKAERARTREDAINRLRASRWKLPPGFKFDREDANGR